MRVAAEQPERQSAANQGCRGPYAPFHNWKDHDNDGSGRGPAGLEDHAYDVVVRYLM